MKTRLLHLLLAALAALAAVTPRDAWARHPHGPPPGRVVVYNQSGGTVTVTLSGQPGRTLPAWQTAELVAYPGETMLRATYFQFGAEQVLESERVYVVPGRTSSVTLAPERTARVLVTNDSPFYAQLFVDGRPGAKFTPGEARVVSLTVGRADLELVADGRPLGRATMSLRAFEEPRWTVSPPRLGDLVVRNPLPIPIQLVCDKGLVRNVAPYGSTTYTGLPAGGFRLTARRVTGEFIDSETAAIRAGTTTGWSVDAPRTGFVSLDSDHWLGVEVRLDGKRMVSLAPDAVHKLEAKVGWHELTVIDDRGRVVLSTWVEFEPYEVNRVSFGVPSHTPARDHHSDRRDRDQDRDHDHGHDHDDHVVAEAGESCGMR